jgi:hypothetical protein
MSRTRGGRLSTYVERSYLDDIQGEQDYEQGRHDYEQGEHDYDHEKHQSQYTPTRPADTFILQLQE